MTPMAWLQSSCPRSQPKSVMAMALLPLAKMKGKVKVLKGLKCSSCKPKTSQALNTILLQHIGRVNDRYPVWIDSHRSRWDRNDFTDDTDQMLLLLQSLQQTQDGRLHAANFSKRLREWSVIGFPELGTPPRGIGYTVGSTLSHPQFRINPHKAAFDVSEPSG